MAVVDKMSVNSLPMIDGQRVDVGHCDGLRVRCVSEPGWWDNAKVIGDVMAAGGMQTNQWTMPWSEGNAAGACNLVEVDYPGGNTRRFLMDCGWDSAYIGQRLADTGVDKMIADGRVEFLYMTHEHMDHFFGIEAVLGLRADLPIVIPSTFSQTAKDFIKGQGCPISGAGNCAPHTGALIELEPGQVHQLMPGCASVTFDLPIILDVRGEQSLYFLVADKGVVAVTGCCHQGVQELLQTPQRTIGGGQRLYGLYGGLHIAPFGPLAPEQDALIDWLGDQGLCKVAANHCTGLPAVEKMIEKGLPVARGTGAHGSRSDLHPGNGDWTDF